MKSAVDEKETVRLREADYIAGATVREIGRRSKIETKTIVRNDGEVKEKLRSDENW